MKIIIVEGKVMVLDEETNKVTDISPDDIVVMDPDSGEYLPIEDAFVFFSSSTSEGMAYMPFIPQDLSLLLLALQYIQLYLSSIKFDELDSDYIQ